MRGAQKGSLSDAKRRGKKKINLDSPNNKRGGPHPISHVLVGKQVTCCIVHFTHSISISICACQNHFLFLKRGAPANKLVSCVGGVCLEEEKKTRRELHGGGLSLSPSPAPPRRGVFLWFPFKKKKVPTGALLPDKVRSPPD